MLHLFFLPIAIFFFIFFILSIFHFFDFDFPLFSFLPPLCTPRRHSHRHDDARRLTRPSLASSPLLLFLAREWQAENEKTRCGGALQQPPCPPGQAQKKNGRDPLSLEHFQCSKQRIQHFDFLNLTHFGIIAPSNVNSLRHCVPPPGALRRTSPPALDYAPFFFSHLAGVAEPTFQPLLAIVAIGRRREPSSQSSSRHIGFCNHSCQPVGPPFDIRINNCDPRAARPPPRALAPGPQIDTRRRAALVVTSFRRRTNRPAQDPPQVHRTGPGVNTLSRRGRAGSISDEGLIQPR